MRQVLLVGAGDDADRLCVQLMMCGLTVLTVETPDGPSDRRLQQVLSDPATVAVIDSGHGQRAAAAAAARAAAACGAPVITAEHVPAFLRTLSRRTNS